MKTIDLSLLKGAIFSDDGRYRYALWRVWKQSPKLLMFIGLNPSKANQWFNDPTITRLVVRADKDGFGGLLAANLYAMVSTNPNDLLTRENPVGNDTDDYLKQMIDMSDKVLCAWGTFPAAKARAEIVLKMVSAPHCLGTNRDGTPKHPLYIPYDQKIMAIRQTVRKE